MAFNLPLPKVVADVGPGGGIPSAINALNAIQKQGLENSYYGPTAQANIASKNTYARYLPAQILGQVLSNPLVWQTMPKEQLQALSNQYTNALTNPPSVESLGGRPTSNGLLSRFVNWLDNKQGGQGAQNPLAQSAMPAQQNQKPIASDAMVNDIAMNGNNGYNNNQQKLPNTTINGLAPSNTLPGAQGGINPASVAGAQVKGLETTATSEASAQTQQWTDIIKRDSQLANGAQQNLNYLDKISLVQPKLGKYEKGPLWGRLPAASEAAYEFDTSANALANSVAQANEKGHITDAARDTYSGIKPNRQNPDVSFKHMVDFNKGMNRRLLELPAFNNAVKKLGLDPNQAQAIWTYYSNERPFYDPKTNKIPAKNLGTWEDFLTPQKIAQALSPRAQQQAAQNANKKVPKNVGTTQPGKIEPFEGQQPPSGTRWMLNPQGQKEAVNNEWQIGDPELEGYEEVE